MTLPAAHFETQISTDSAVNVAYPVGAVVGGAMPRSMAAAVLLKVGDKVDARWADDVEEWYEAAVVSIHPPQVRTRVHPNSHPCTHANTQVCVNYVMDDVEAVVPMSNLRRRFAMPDRFCYFDTTGWQIMSHMTDGSPVFRRPAPPVPPRGSGSTPRIVAYIWNTHPEIMKWYVCLRVHARTSTSPRTQVRRQDHWDPEEEHPVQRSSPRSLCRLRARRT